MLNNSLFKWLINDLIGIQTNEDKAVKPQEEVIDYSGNDCFENRIYNDLCEDILEWLPIDDKIKLRAVSPQFHFCLNNVLKRRRVLKIDKDVTDVDNLVLARIREDVRARPLLGLHATDELLYALSPVTLDKSLDKYLQICPNTVGFHCGRSTYLSEKIEVLEAVLQNCSHLESFAFDFRECPQDMIDRFGQQFGKSLKSLELCQTVLEVPESVRSLLMMCSNLSSLVNINFDYLFDADDQICMTGLTKFKSTNVNNNHRFRVFVKHNPDLTRLMVGFSETTPSEMSDFLVQISKLKSLIYLDIRFVDFDYYDRHMAQSFETIVRECVQLKKLVLKVESAEAFDFSHFIQSFKRLYNLKRLCIEIRANAPLKTGFLDVKYIKNCRELTHLDLTYDHINDEFFQGIHVLFPNLRTLTVKVRHELTDEAMVSLSKLKRLETLIIDRNENEELKSITDLGILTVINGCRRLTLLEIHNPISITEVSLLAMVRKAVRHTDMRFKYYIEHIESQLELHHYPNYDRLKLPPNLVVMGAHYYSRR